MILRANAPGQPVALNLKPPNLGQCGEMVQAKVITGNKDMIKMFNFFAQNSEKGAGHLTIGYKEFLSIAQKLEVRHPSPSALEAWVARRPSTLASHAKSCIFGSVKLLGT